MPLKSLILFSLGLLLFPLAALADHPEFAPCGPGSEFAQEPVLGASAATGTTGPSTARFQSVDFCAAWNPEFPYNGYRCCSKYVISRARRANMCGISRRKASYCDEMTDEQREYTEAVSSGKIPDVLPLIGRSMTESQLQNFCHVNNGFLAFGRRLVPTAQNRISLRRPERCVDFGTDGMVGMLEWVGRKVAERYSWHSGIKLVVGDISAPRGGCLSGRGGRRGHKSHTSGIDADVGFLSVKAGKESPLRFHRDFDPDENWWLIKQIFKNPYACVKVMFLDKKHIRKLAKFAAGDEDWRRYERFIRHVRHHKDHLHIRVGEKAGAPGCVADPQPELETEEDQDEAEET